MKSTKLFIACAITLAVASGSWLTAQVQTNVPEVVPGAKPVTVEHIKIHGAALEGNLEGDAVDRDVIVFLPPSYAERQESPLSRGLRAARLLHRRRAVDARDPRAADDRRRICAGRARR